MGRIRIYVEVVHTVTNETGGGTKADRLVVKISRTPIHRTPENGN